MNAPAVPHRTPLAAAVVADAVQRIETDGPLDDHAALRQAFASQPTRAAQVAERAWLLGQRLGLPRELARWHQLGWWAVAALALMMAFTGLGLARAVLGEGRSINAVAAFVSLLGLHAIMLLIWMLGLALSHGRWAPPLGRAALWLTARIPFERGPHAPVLMQSFTAVLQRQRLLGWLTGAISHGIWTLAFVITLVVLAFGFAFRAYTLTWETTILSTEFFQRFVQWTGALPALLGFAVPDAEAVQRAGNAAVPAQQREWAWWLMGCVVVYGLLPRALLAALCGWRWRAGTGRLEGQIDMADPYIRRIAQRLDALEPPPEVIDPERVAPTGATPARPSLPPGAPGSFAVVGFELPPEAPWPLPGLPEGTQPPERIAGSGPERQAVLTRLAHTRPESLLLVVHAPASPDRGTARFVREAMREAGRSALLLHGAEDHGGARRWRDWVDFEGFEALALAESAQAATEWIASAQASSHG
ncbi:DUF2868 domain-containing protein [Ottowia testudinis]|uniref:DUF2868 domain-containing protein n=1 Tax=Ottowia testudinis TaxID=2816950 RepID=A0A975CFZ7_9BURK|nr:DUF2868 domain-containing protein [Ottowia testudinis]QTD44167.1 DUF2868 domain-containing protein [Ottowia testudinis]